jgi:hypothetical protein
MTKTHQRPSIKRIVTGIPAVGLGILYFTGLFSAVFAVILLAAWGLSFSFLELDWSGMR